MVQYFPTSAWGESIPFDCYGDLLYAYRHFMIECLSAGEIHECYCDICYDMDDDEEELDTVDEIEYILDHLRCDVDYTVE